jgi:ribosomal-protein-alanine N-acetyltransferase
MLELQPLGDGHQTAVLAFERENRAYFTRFISDRGDSYFEEFAERHGELLADQQSGIGAFFVLVDADGAVAGRFNLYNIHGQTADVGYRIAEWAAGRGVATSGLRTLCQVARDDLGLRRLTAAASNDNVASQKVLVKAGFSTIGQAEVGGHHGSLFELDLNVA